MLKTKAPLKPLDAVDDDSAAMVAESGYTPPTPTPRTNRVMARKSKMVAGLSLFRGTYKLLRAYVVEARNAGKLNGIRGCFLCGSAT